MAQSSVAPSSTPAARAARPARRRMEQGRKRLLLASAMGLVGSFLPWLLTGVGNVNGARGAGLYVAYAAVLGLAGALMPMRRVASVQGFVLASAAVVLPLWQLVHIWSLVGFAGWTPGPGLVMCLGAGVLAGIGSLQLWHRPAEA
ncbi:hypothetical protein KC207_08005 [Phycicoccus sp. BSK3Z-2]|uniref:Uncharacterized protein n=1 Tax=Phycicoccus avicenniae TaxID=2828860 RepID=A0A941D830_9MICO|nr:hypothetical protein [Phycicoccus avicenniae]MBR7743231.1 hypothetical protein [Phycicoccus avicenniae]